MIKTIKLQNRLKYQNELKETIEVLEKFETELTSRMINLATLDKWQEWDEEQNVGTVFQFTSDMLQDTGDVNIDKLFKILESIRMTSEEITKG
jgi:thymidylate synthase